jgi:hypothetical protein
VHGHPLSLSPKKTKKTPKKPKKTKKLAFNKHYNQGKN